MNITPEKHLTVDEILELYAEFSAETSGLNRQATEFKPKLAQLEERHQRFREERNALVALGETKKAKVLKGELDKMQAEIDEVRGRLSALQPGPEALVASANGSRLHNLAEQIVESAAAIQQDLQREAQAATRRELDEKKEAYFAWIDSVDEKFFDLWEICRVGLLTQRFLPKEKRICSRPRLVAPDQSDFAIDGMDCARHFKLYSKAFLPEES
jgi:hypothetical protein